MSVIPSLAWQTSGTPDYITRQEVIDFASSVVQYISAGGLSSINVNVGPNPSFSTVSLNATGSLNMNGAALVSAQSLGMSTNNGFVLATVGATGTSVVPTSIGATSANTAGGIQMNSGFVRSFYQTPGNPTGASQKGWVFNRDGIYGASNDDWTGAGAVGVPGLLWNGSNGGNLWALQNISTINGVNPTTSGTTFTTLTGTTLNSSNVNTNALGSVSSINGLVKVAPFTASYNATASSVPAAAFTSLFTISVPFTIPPNSIVSVSVPVKISAFASGSPAIAYFDLGVRVGGTGGQVAFTNSLALPTGLPTGSAGYVLSAQVLTPASPTNTIEVCCCNNTGATLTVQIANPVSPANRYSIFVPT